MDTDRNNHDEQAAADGEWEGADHPLIADEWDGPDHPLTPGDADRGVTPANAHLLVRRTVRAPKVLTVRIHATASAYGVSVAALLGHAVPARLENPKPVERLGSVPRLRPAVAADLVDHSLDVKLPRLTWELLRRRASADGVRTVDVIASASAPYTKAAARAVAQKLDGTDAKAAFPSPVAASDGGWD